MQLSVTSNSLDLGTVWGTSEAIAQQFCFISIFKKSSMKISRDCNIAFKRRYYKYIVRAHTTW